MVSRKMCGGWTGDHVQNVLSHAGFQIQNPAYMTLQNPAYMTLQNLAYMVLCPLDITWSPAKCAVGGQEIMCRMCSLMPDFNCKIRPT